MEMLIAEIWDWLAAFAGAIPGRAGRLLRRWLYRAALAQAGPTLSIGRGVEIACPRNIQVGDKIFLVDGAVLRACESARIVIGNRFSANGNARLIADNGGRILVGNDVMIGPNVVIRASNHETSRTDVSIWDQGHALGCIKIGDDVWIGANVVIVSNVTVGSHVVIAAGAIVTKDVPDYAVAAGVPARVIADRRDARKTPSPGPAAA